MELPVGDVNGNCTITYLSHIQKILEEHEVLQLEHSRLRQQFNEHVILSKGDTGSYGSESSCKPSDDDLRSELNKSLRGEVDYLLDEVRKTQKRYNDLLIIVKNEQETRAVCDSEKNELLLKISQLTNENKELKENIEFINSENKVLTSSLKDNEELFFKERMEWVKEKESYEEVVTWSRKIYETNNINKAKIEQMEKMKNQLQDFTQKLVSHCDTESCRLLLTQFNDTITTEEHIPILQQILDFTINLIAELNQIKDKFHKLSDKYIRNREVWQKNEENYRNEMEKLDNFIQVILDTLNRLPNEIKDHPDLVQLLQLIEQKKN